MIETMENLPEISGNEEAIEKYAKHKKDIFYPASNIAFNKAQSGFGVALHMHQPIIPAGGDNLATAKLISNLQYMMEHQNIGDNHNAAAFLKCYSRMSDFIRELADSGKNPRIMLDYSGNLLWGLKDMGEEKVLENLKLVTCDKKYYPYVEWLGTMWSHSVPSSTPVPDIILHIKAWQEHFASIFGVKALERVKGFSAPEMHLPIHPDACFEYVKALKECGYRWLMVQEHTIENLDASPVRRPHFPHKLAAKNSLGEKAEITVIIKTQGSDNKLIGQMQPYYEAKTLGHEKYCGVDLPGFVAQIGDGENGGVMMNEFPQAYKIAYGEIGREGVVGMNGTEYLEFVKHEGLDENSFMPVQPVTQGKIWEFLKEYSPGAADRAIEKVKQKYPGFSLEKASWTNDKDWVSGYKDVMDPVLRLSAEFHKKFDGKDIDKGNAPYKKALLYLLVSQTSCFRYWGSGAWTDYAKEICRRGMDSLK
ncbi:MAG: glycosyl hydrolase family 57 [Candidatus Omnitrophota bacterium]|nr:glycosyl hydrolase family 57 [Candidatus Omnitrophota bacterium]